MHTYNIYIYIYIYIYAHTYTHTQREDDPSIIRNKNDIKEGSTTLSLKTKTNGKLRRTRNYVIAPEICRVFYRWRPEQ